MIRVRITAIALALAAAGATHAVGPTTQPHHPDAAELAAPVRSAGAPLPARATQQLIEEGGKPMASLADVTPAGPTPATVRGAPPPAPLGAEGSTGPAVGPAFASELAAPIGPALATEPASARPSASARLTPAERDFATKEEALLRQIRLLDLNIEVSEREQKLRGIALGGQGAVAAAAAPMPRLAEIDAVAGPRSQPVRQAAAPAHPFRLLSIWGRPGALRAEIAGGAGTRTVGVGDAIGEGWVLEDVRSDEVTVRKGSRRSTLKVSI